MALVGGSTYKNFDRRETIFLTNSTSVLNDMPKQLLPGQLHMWRIQTENNNPIRRAKKIELNQKRVRKYLQRKRATDIMDEENSLAQTALKRYFQSAK